MPDPASEENPGFYDLLGDLQRSPPSVFSILPSSPDRERTHTRFLQWLFSPHETHEADTVFLEAFLELTGSEVTADSIEKCSAFQKISVEDLPTTRAERSEAEIDLVLHAPNGVVGVEIKTRGKEQAKKFYDEYLALQQFLDDDEECHLVYLPPRDHRGFSDDVEQEGVPTNDFSIVKWPRLRTAIQREVGVVSNPYVASIMTDFLSTVQSSISEQYEEPPAGALLRMLHPDQCEAAGVRGDVERVWEDYRNDIFRRIITRVAKKYGDSWEWHSPNGRIAVYRSGDVWSGEGFDKQSYPPVSIQILTQNDRIEQGSYGDSVPEPFIEVTLTIEHKKSNRDARRVEFFDHLSGDELPSFSRDIDSNWHALRKKICILDHDTTEELADEIFVRVEQLLEFEPTISNAIRTADRETGRR